jgi:phosphoglycerate dehydrogenase-like enzyme
VKVLVSHEADDQVGRRLLAELPVVQVLPYDPATDKLSAEQRTAEVLIPPYRGSHRPIPLLAQLPALRMVQLLSAGADEWQADVRADVLLATARGAHARPVAEWVLSAILALYRQWPALVRAQDEHVWAHRQFALDTLADKRVLVLGAGAIGRKAAELVAAFGAEPTLVARTARPGVHPVVELLSLLGEHQVLVVAAPLTPETERLIDAAALAALPDGALVVNAGRGRIIDNGALVAEVKSGRLRAALDVTDPEPLPADHPLWTLPGVIISPHSARTVPGTNGLCYQVAVEQIRKLLDGEAPTNLVSARRTE